MDLFICPCDYCIEYREMANIIAGRDFDRIFNFCDKLLAEKYALQERLDKSPIT